MVFWPHFKTFLSVSGKWLPGPIIFIVLVVILFTLRLVLLRSIARASKHRGQWIDALLRALSPSLGVAIVVVALALAMGFGTDPDELAPYR
jgi:short subunit fatty acids transporter